MTSIQTVFESQDACVDCTPIGVGKNFTIWVKRKRESDHDWSFLDASQYIISSLWDKAKERLGYKVPPLSESSLAIFKNTWVIDNKETIIEVSKWFNLPPEIIAGVAWSEVGGSPEVEDPFVHNIRSAIYGLNINIGSPPNLTSIGDIQIQIRHVAGYLGFPDPENISYFDRLGLIKFIETDRNNIYVVGRYLSHNLKQVYPDYTANSLSDNDIVMVGYMYNMGYPHKLIGKDTDLSEIERRGISSYGFDLLKKKQKMRQLLGIKK